MRIRIDVEGHGAWESNELVGMGITDMRAEQGEINAFADQGDGWGMSLVGGTEADKELFQLIVDMVGDSGGYPSAALYAMWKLGQEPSNYLHMVMLARDKAGMFDNVDEMDMTIEIAESEHYDNWGDDRPHYVLGIGSNEDEARIECARYRHGLLMQGELGSDMVDWEAVAKRLLPEIVRHWSGKYYVLDFKVNPDS